MQSRYQSTDNKAALWNALLDDRLTLLQPIMRRIR
jgi:hypothetical protein